MILTDANTGQIIVTFNKESNDKQLLLNEAVKRITGIDVLQKDDRNYIVFNEEVDIIIYDDFSKKISTDLAIIGEFIYLTKNSVIIVITEIKNRRGENLAPAIFFWENRGYLNFQNMDISV